MYFEKYEFLNILGISGFLFEFLVNKYPYLKSQKGGSYLQVLTWRAGAADALTWRARPPRGCDAALRPRGRATGGPRGAQVAHKARTRGRWPRGPRGRPSRVPRGSEVGIWRAQGYSGALDRKSGR